MAEQNSFIIQINGNDTRFYKYIKGEQKSIFVRNMQDMKARFKKEKIPNKVFEDVYKKIDNFYKQKKLGFSIRIFTIGFDNKGVYQIICKPKNTEIIFNQLSINYTKEFTTISINVVKETPYLATKRIENKKGRASKMKSFIKTYL